MAKQNLQRKVEDGRLLRVENATLKIGSESFKVEVRHYESGVVLEVEGQGKYTGPSMYGEASKLSKGLYYQPLRVQDEDGDSDGISLVI